MLGDVALTVTGRPGGRAFIPPDPVELGLRTHPGVIGRWCVECARPGAVRLTGAAVAGAGATLPRAAGAGRCPSWAAAALLLAGWPFWLTGLPPG